MVEGDLASALLDIIACLSEESQKIIVDRYWELKKKNSKELIFLINQLIKDAT